MTQKRRAELLMDRAQLRLLGPFLGQASGVAAAARQLGVETEWLYKRVKRFQAQGLLHPCGTVQRAGRPITLYRTAADTYFVPFTVLPPQHIGRTNRRLHAALFEQSISRSFQQPPFDSQDWGACTARTPGGDLYLEIVREDGRPWSELQETSPVMVSGWNVLHLSPPAARQLQQEMRQLYSRYAAMQGSRTCLMGIFLTDTTDLPGLEHPSSPG